jgi:hypothetical protein
VDEWEGGRERIMARAVARSVNAIGSSKIITNGSGVFLIKTRVNPFFAQYGDT